MAERSPTPSCSRSRLLDDDPRFGFAYVIRFRAGRFGNALLFLTLITLFGGYLVKIYAWKSILGRDGILNLALINLNIIDEPLSALIQRANGIVVTLTYFLLPFAVLPIYSNMRAIQEATLEASRDLGASLEDDEHYRHPPVRAGHPRRLHVRLPDFGRRLCDAALRRRWRGDDGQFHRDAVLLRLQLAEGSAMAFSTMGVSLLTVIIFRRLLQQWLKP